MKLANLASEDDQFHPALFALRAQRVPALRGKRLPPNQKIEKQMSEKPTRKGSTNIRVCVTPDEKKEIEFNAKNVGLSTSAYLRNIGLGLSVRGVLDQKAVIELSKVNGDLGRLGGLLKMWLTNDERLAIFNQDQLKASILESLGKITEIQNQMLEKVKKV